MLTSIFFFSFPLFAKKMAFIKLKSVYIKSVETRKKRFGGSLNKNTPTFLKNKSYIVLFELYLTTICRLSFKKINPKSFMIFVV